MYLSDDFRSEPLLLQTKLSLPVARLSISRTHLFQKLNDGLNRKLILVSAPAGFGKTTLVTNWLETQMQHEDSVAYTWFSLDERDNDPTRFIAYLIGAFQRLNPHIGKGLQTASYAYSMDDVNLMEAVTVIINDMIALVDEIAAKDIVIVFEDFHAINNLEILSLVEHFLEYLPPFIHIVMLTRADPELPLARLRAERQIIEIRESELQFTTQEAQGYLRDVMKLDLPSHIVQDLVEHAEGWIAGLHLAALAIQANGYDPQHVIDEMIGTHHYIMDYLFEEVFRHQPLDLQQFLLETSISGRLSSGLCNAICQRDDSTMMLDMVERRSLFLVTLDHRRRWFRYHHLFANFLQVQIQRKNPAIVPILHQRASVWYASLADNTGDLLAMEEALSHAQAAKDDERLVQLLIKWTDILWERGQHDQLRYWIDELGADILDLHPQLGLFKAWDAMSRGHYASVKAILDVVEKADTPSTIHVDELQGRIAAIRAFVANMAGPQMTKHLSAQAALSLLRDPLSPWHILALIARGDAHSLAGDYTASHADYNNALRSSRETANIYLELNLKTKLGLNLRARGLLHQANEICTSGIDLAEKHSLMETELAGALFALSGDIHLEWNRLEDARTLTYQATQTVTRVRHVGFLSWIYLLRARVLLFSGELDDVQDVVRELSQLQGTVPLPYWIAPFLSALEASVALARRDTSRLNAWAGARLFPLDKAEIHFRGFEYVNYAQLLMLEQRFEEADTVLSTTVEVAEQHGMVSLQIPTLIVQTFSQMFQRNTQSALALLRHAVELAEPGSFVHVFHYGDGRLFPLIQQLASEQPSSYLEVLLKSFSLPEREQQRHQTQLVENLTKREREVLSLITDGLKNQDIANALSISLNTVLYHTKNIYGKLNVANRTQAAQRAQEFNLI